MSAALALQKALFEALTSDTILTAMLGTGKVFDEALPTTNPPYVVFSPATSNDWSTGTETGEEHILTLDVWSSHKGSVEVASLAAQVRDVALTLAEIAPPHRLVNIVHQATRITREDQGGYYRAQLQMRAVTEPL
ncbi:MAG: DUF3168 domain-containing protein [Nitratireductor sp.]